MHASVHTHVRVARIGGGVQRSNRLTTVSLARFSPNHCQISKEKPLSGVSFLSCFLWDFCALRAQPNQDLTTSPHRKIYLQSFWEMTTQEEEVGLQTKLWFGALFASDAKLTVLVMSSTNRISWCLSSLHGDGIGAHVNVGFDPLHHLQILISRLWGVAAAPRWNMVWDCRCVKLWCAWNP